MRTDFIVYVYNEGIVYSSLPYLPVLRRTQCGAIYVFKDWLDGISRNNINPDRTRLINHVIKICCRSEIINNCALTNRVLFWLGISTLRSKCCGRKHFSAAVILNINKTEYA